MAGATWAGRRAGEQLGHLEYVIDDAALEEYRRLVGSAGRYPNLLADDCRALLLQRWEDAPAATVWQRFDFFRPPVSGRRIQVGGWLREVWERNGQPWLRVGTFSVDEIGTEILRAEAAFVSAGEPEPAGAGFPALVSGWLEATLGHEFGDDFRWGGRLSISFHSTANPGDVLTADGVIVEQDTDDSGAETSRAVLTVRNGSSVRLATAEAVVTSPSPRLL